MFIIHKIWSFIFIEAFILTFVRWGYYLVMRDSTNTLYLKHLDQGLLIFLIILGLILNQFFERWMDSDKKEMYVVEETSDTVYVETR